MQTPSNNSALIIDTTVGVMRPFKREEAFPVASTYEIFRCDDKEGAFIQIAGPIQTKEQAEQALGLFTTHPDFKGSRVRLFMVECRRVPVMGNFNPKLILPPNRT